MNNKIKQTLISLIILILIILLTGVKVFADSQSFELVYAEDLIFINTSSSNEGNSYGDFDDIEAEIISSLPAGRWDGTCLIDIVIGNTENFSYNFILMNFSVRIRFPDSGWASSDPDYFGIQYLLRSS